MRPLLCWLRPTFTSGQLHLMLLKPLPGVERRNKSLARIHSLALSTGPLMNITHRFTGKQKVRGCRRHPQLSERRKIPKSQFFPSQFFHSLVSVLLLLGWNRKCPVDLIRRLDNKIFLNGNQFCGLKS